MVAFQVKATTNSSPNSYRWYYEGFPISWGTNSTLLLNNLAFADAGNYWAVVSNSVGSATSNPALLVVNPAGVSLGLYPGLSITGTLGKTFGIQYTTNVSQTSDWITLQTLMLTQSPQLWLDTNANVSSGYHPRRFYRVIAVP